MTIAGTYWTIWYDRDDPTHTGDWEELAKQGRVCTQHLQSYKKSVLKMIVIQKQIMGSLCMHILHPVRT